MKTIFLVLLSLFAVHCAEKPKAKISVTPGPKKPVEKTPDEIILESTAESFFGASLARYSLRIDPFEKSCGGNIKLPTNSCIKLKLGSSANVKLLDYDYCEKEGITGYQKFVFSHDEDTLSIEGNFKFTTGAKVVERTQSLTATIKGKDCTWYQKTIREGRDYVLKNGTYDGVKDAMSVEMIEVGMGSVEKAKATNNESFIGRKFDLTKVALQWKKDCPHPPLGFADFDYFDPKLPQKTIKGKIESVMEGDKVSTTGEVKKLNWTTRCKTGTTSGELPVGLLINPEI